MAVRLVIGLLMTVAALAIASRRLFWLYKLIKAGQPVDRLDHLPKRVGVQLTEVFGQRKLLKWSGPGIAHFFTFWGFIVLGATILEAYGALFSRDFHIPWIGKPLYYATGGQAHLILLALLVLIATPELLRLVGGAGDSEADAADD